MFLPIILKIQGKKVKLIIDFSKDGKILNAPKGFFETYMLDVMDIALNA